MSDSSLWDDHNTVVVLENLIKRMIVKQCNSNPNADAELQDWLAWLKGQSDLTMRFAFKEARSDDIQLNAISLSAEYNRFREEIEQDFRE